MYKYQQPSRETGYKEQVEEGFYKALPTEGMEQFKAADYYSNLTINSAFYKEGTKILDNGESYPWAFITCEVIDCNQNKKGWMSLSLTTQNGQERMNELVYLLKESISVKLREQDRISLLNRICRERRYQRSLIISERTDRKPDRLISRFWDSLKMEGLQGKSWQTNRLRNAEIWRTAYAP